MSESTPIPAANGAGRELLLEATGLDISFGGVHAVRGVDMRVYRGETLALVGANGAGKSTVFNMVAGAYKPDAGRVVFKGEDITSLKDFQRNRIGIARTFQVVRPLANLTVLENAMIGAFSKTRSVSDAQEIAYRALEDLGLVDKAKVLGKDLTLTFRKRLEVARALASEPELLLLDEMMAGLNPSELDRFIENLKRIVAERGITLVLVEHVMRAVLQLAERAIVMNQGLTIAEGLPDAVMKDPAVIEAYLGDSHAIA